jgi:hypothetical protein
MDAFQVLAAITFIAAAVNGGVGYGFSSCGTVKALLLNSPKGEHSIAILGNGRYTAESHNGQGMVQRRQEKTRT